VNRNAGNAPLIAQIIGTGQYPYIALGKKKKKASRGNAAPSAAAFDMLRAYSRSMLIRGHVVLSDDSPVSVLAVALSAPLVESAAGSKHMLARDAVAHVGAALTLDHLAAQDIFALRDASARYGGDGAVDAPRSGWHEVTATEATRVSHAAAATFDALLSRVTGGDGDGPGLDSASDATAHGVYSVHREADAAAGGVLLSFASSADAAVPSSLSERLPSIAGDAGVLSVRRQQQDAHVNTYIDETMRLALPREHLPLLLLARVAVAVAADAMVQRGNGREVTNDSIARIGAFTADLFSLVHAYTSRKPAPKALPRDAVAVEAAEQPPAPVAADADTSADAALPEPPQVGKNPLSCLMEWD
jgi:hypothetical protein